LLKVEGHFNVTGPLETFANAGGVHLARAILAEFAENIAKVVSERAAPPPEDQQAVAPAASQLKSGRILWRAFVSWLRELFFGKRDA